jgi:ATP-dependent helicase/nuclease subunit B
MCVGAAALLPYRAAFDTFAEKYLDWLREHEKAGWRFQSGEDKRRCAPPDLDGVVLEGRLDRVDRHADGAAMLIDYKTGRPEKLKQRVSEPLEDTQLAFYAALLTDEAGETPPRAIYLSLAEREAPKPIEHKDVALSAALLIDGLAADLEALRQGAGAAALGEGDVCRTCEARGLCRRDQWSGQA